MKIQLLHDDLMIEICMNAKVSFLLSKKKKNQIPITFVAACVLVEKASG